MRLFTARDLRRYLCIMICALFTHGCLVAPDGTVIAQTDNLPPRIDLNSLKPQRPISEVSHPANFAQDCPGIKLRADVFEPDGDPILVRFVANNFVDNLATIISEQEYPASVSGTYIVQDTLLPSLSLIGLDVQNTHVISLFVTDAPQFSELSEQSSNLAEIDADPDGDGKDDYSLIEHRWTLQFVDRGELCPQ